MASQASHRKHCVSRGLIWKTKRAREALSRDRSDRARFSINTNSKNDNCSICLNVSGGYEILPFSFLPLPQHLFLQPHSIKLFGLSLEPQNLLAHSISVIQISSLLLKKTCCGSSHLIDSRRYAASRSRSFPSLLFLTQSSHTTLLLDKSHLLNNSNTS